MGDTKERAKNGGKRKGSNTNPYVLKNKLRLKERKRRNG